MKISNTEHANVEQVVALSEEVQFAWEKSLRKIEGEEKRAQTEHEYMQ